jgi:hypothetical protein
MRKAQLGSLLSAATAVAVVLATCGTAIRIPLPLNSAGTAARAKRARRIENIYEVAARSSIAERSVGASGAATPARQSRGERPAIMRLLTIVCADRFSRGWLTPFILDGTPQVLALRC